MGALALRRWSVLAFILALGCASRPPDTYPLPGSWLESTARRIERQWHLRAKSVMIDTITLGPRDDKLGHPSAPVSCAGTRWGCAQALTWLPPDGRTTLVVGFTRPASERLKSRAGFGNNEAIEALAFATWRDVPATLRIGALDVAFYFEDDAHFWQFQADSLDTTQPRQAADGADAMSLAVARSDMVVEATLDSVVDRITYDDGVPVGGGVYYLAHVTRQWLGRAPATLQVKVSRELGQWPEKCYHGCMPIPFSRDTTFVLYLVRSDSGMVFEAIRHVTGTGLNVERMRLNEFRSGRH